MIQFLKTKLIIATLIIVVTSPVFVLCATQGVAIAATDPVLAKCNALLKSEHKTGCTPSNINNAENTALASVACQKLPPLGPDQIRCSNSTAKGYIVTAWNNTAHPKTGANFTNALNTLLGTTNSPNISGNPITPPSSSGGAGTGSSPGSGGASSGSAGSGGSGSGAADTAPGSGASACNLDGKCFDCKNSKNSDCVPVPNNPTATSCDSNNCDIVKNYVNPLINLFSAIVGLAAVASLIIGGIQYTTSSGDPQKVAKARARISMTIVALVAFFLLYGFLQFLVPGGIFNK